MTKNEQTKISFKRIILISVIGSLLIFIFVNANTKSPDELEHEEHMEYIYYCADRARNNIENYIDCMNKRPDIR